MTNLLTMQTTRPAVYEAGRVVAFHIVDGARWELLKRCGCDRWRITKDGALWVETTHAERAYEVFNDILERG